MLLSKTSIIKWNSKNKKHFVELGYQYTKMGEEFEVNVNHLTNGSNSNVEVKCDYCSKIYTIPWYRYLNGHNKDISKDCCGDPKCTGQKASESLVNKYGTRNIFEVPEIKEKLISTNINKFGCENPFANDEIKEKIKKSNLEKYGVEYSMQNPDIVAKSQATCLEKYGVKNYGYIYSKSHIKELSPTWKGGVEYSRVERATYEYNNWRRNVFSRDKYTCQKCGKRNGNGKYIRLEAHHIFDWKNYPDYRYDIDNGITLCSDCHIKFHSEFGKSGNNDKQLNEFLNNIDEKVC